MQSYGRPPSVIPLSAATVKHEPGKKAHKDRPPIATVDGRARFPGGQWSRSLYLITTPKRLVKRIRTIDEKARKPHEFRNNDYTVTGRGLCSWCHNDRHAAIHHF